MKLGVFDSGIGGKAMAASLTLAFPEATIHVVNDEKNVPYGSKTAEQIITLTNNAIQPLLKERCDAIILACNTATMAAIDELRKRYPAQKFIGLEPMVKPAARMTKTGTIAVCATPATLASRRYNWLKDTYAKDVVVLEPDCSDWAQMIQNDRIDKAQIEHVIEDCIQEGADVIVLGCTHYHWIKGIAIDITRGRATILEPSDAIARRVRTLLIEPEAKTTPTIVTRA